MMSIRKKFAFTIIEVLVVVAIIGTLSAIGLNKYSSSLNITRTVTFRENVSAIEDCLNVYFSVNHRYPDTLEEIRGCLNKTPINPFTNEDMLTDGSITYTPLDDNLEYVIVVHQPDEDDYDDDGNTTEPIIEPPVLLSENIHLIVHPAGAGTAKARPNPADSGVVVALSSQAGQCYNFNSWQPLSEITINSPTSPNTTFIMPGNEVSIVSKFDIKRYRVTLNAPGGEEVLGSGDYDCGDRVTVQAVPLTGHYFVGWYSGSTLVSVSPYYTFRIYNDVTLEARFNAIPYTTITETTQADFSRGTLSNVTAAADRLELVPWVDSFTTTLNYTAAFDSDATWRWNTTQGTLVANNGQQSLRLVSNYSATDVDMEVDMTQANDSGLVARFQNNSNYYLLAIRDDSCSASENNLQVYKRQNGNYTSLAVANVTWPRGTQATIRFVVKGNTLKAYFNGTEVINIIDSTFTTAGLVGLRHHETVESVYQEFRVNSGYTASGTRTSPEYNISTTGTVESATITWTANTPAGTSVTVETRVSLDSGATWTSWQTVANGSAVPGLPKGTNLANARIQLRQTLSTTNSAVTPQLLDITVKITSTSP